MVCWEGERGQSLRLLFCSLPKLAEDLFDDISLFQANGREDGFHGPGIGHVDPGAGVHFGPVEKAVESLLIFFAQGPPEWLQPFRFGFHEHQ